MDEEERREIEAVMEAWRREQGIEGAVWRVEERTEGRMVMTWTVDLGHESGTRRWWVATVVRGAEGWTAEVTMAHAHRRRRSISG